MDRIVTKNERKVKGSFTLQFHPAGQCSPHQGACLTGTAEGDLAGEVQILVLASTATQAGRFVSGSLATITIRRDVDNVLDGIAAGLLDRVTGEFKNVVYWVGGTGRYAGVGGYIRTEGFDTPEGVEHSAYEGFLRFPEVD
jgi:hypothetical protein